MSDAQSVSPVGEYERRIAERRRSSRNQMLGYLLVWVVSQGLLPVVLPLAEGWYAHRQMAEAFVYWLFFVATMAAAGMAAVALRGWSFLYRRWIVVGLAPWVVLIGEVMWAVATPGFP